MEFIMTANGKVTATLLILPLYLNFYLKRNNLLKNLLNNHDFILCLLKSKKEIYIYTRFNLKFIPKGTIFERELIYKFPLRRIEEREAVSIGDKLPFPSRVIIASRGNISSAMVPFVANLHQGEQGRRFLDTGQPGINHNETRASLYLQALCVIATGVSTRIYPNRSCANSRFACIASLSFLFFSFSSRRPVIFAGPEIHTRPDMGVTRALALNVTPNRAYLFICTNCTAP